MVAQCWDSVADDAPALNQCWVGESCLLYADNARVLLSTHFTGEINAVLMLGQRCRQWPAIKTTLVDISPGHTIHWINVGRVGVTLDHSL